MNTLISKLCLSYMQGRMNNKEFFSFVISEMIQKVDDIKFVSEFARKNYEPEGGDGS